MRVSTETIRKTEAVDRRCSHLQSFKFVITDIPVQVFFCESFEIEYLFCMLSSGNCSRKRSFL